MNINTDINNKICPKCKILKPRTDFYPIKGQKIKVSGLCKSCILIFNVDQRQEAKRQAVAYKGGGCSKCGYNKCLAALHFHHLDPKDKDKTWNHLKSKFSDKMKLELDKCVLLCANCHIEEHNSI